MTPAEVAMVLVEHLDRSEEHEFLPPEAAHERAKLRARWPQAPATLIELWDYCGGEQNEGVFVLARPLLPPFPSGGEQDTNRGRITGMMLDAPSRIVWNAEELPNTDERWDPAWLPFAHTGTGELLCVDRDGEVVLWSKQIDDDVESVHASFDDWMREVATALQAGTLRITPADPSGDAGERFWYTDQYYFEHGAGVWCDAAGDEPLP